MRNFLFFLLITFLGLFSCSQAPSNFEGGSLSKEASYADESDVEANEHAIEPLSSNSIPRKLIKNARIEFEAENGETSRTNIEKYCKDFGGYFVSENHQTLPDRLMYYHEIRLPANHFDAFLKSMEGAGKNLQISVDAKDVTEEYIDVEARLKTKKELEQKYIALLKQAKNVSDVLAIEQQAGIVRAEIESMQGRMNYLKDQVAFSTISINYYQTIGTDFGFASKFVASMKKGWDNLLLFLIGLTTIWPFLLFIGIGTWFYLRRRKNRRLQLSPEKTS
jgi:hypothetical protein